jgi:hypothetical protein
MLKLLSEARSYRIWIALVLVALACILTGPALSKVFANNASDFTQTINAGTLATDIRDASRNAVASPSVAMGTKTFSFDCLSGGSASTGTFGTNTERIYVDNPDAADNGWTLTLAATGGATTLWENTGATKTYDFNDSSGSGCTDGADADSKGGQMTVDPSVGTLTADCGTCATTNITKGSSNAFVEGTTNNITLLTGAAGSDDVGRWYFTGVSMSQTIPAEQPADSTYDINLTLTVTAS